MERTALPSYETEIGRWLGALEESRADLLDILQVVTSVELHAELTPGAHSIGTILWHMANVELWWNEAILRGREIPAADRERFGLTRPGEMNVPPADWALEQFLDLMAEARSMTLAAYRDMTAESFHRPDRGHKNWSPAWVLYNLVDHEANHRGQIAMLVRLLRRT